MIYWFTGQPGHGKTVQANYLLSYLNDGMFTYKEAFHIDGDDLRALVQNQDYSRQGRENNIRLAQSIAKYLNNKGHDVVVSLVAPYRELREEFKKDMNDSIIEIYVHTDEIRGREQFHTDYEAPTDRFIDLCTTDEDEIHTHKRLIDTLTRLESME